MALRLDDGTRKGRTYKAVFFSASWTDETLYVPKQYVTVISEGSLSEFFDHTLNPPSPSGPQGSSGGTSGTADDKDKEQIDEFVFHPTGSCAKDILLVRNWGLEIDSDNELTPENVPEENELPPQPNLFQG